MTGEQLGLEPCDACRPLVEQAYTRGRVDAAAAIRATARYWLVSVDSAALWARGRVPRRRRAS